MKSVLEQTKDEIIVGSYSVSMPVKVFDIICNDFKKLEKQNEILIEALSKTKDIAQDMLDADKNNCCSLYSYGDYQYVADEALAKIEKDEHG